MLFEGRIVAYSPLGKGDSFFCKKREYFRKKNPANTELWVIARSQLSWHDGNNHCWYLRCDQETWVHKMGEKNPKMGNVMYRT